MMVKTITKEELKEMNDVILVNVLSKELYDRIHIKDSISIPFDELSEEGWKELDKEKKYVVYCYNFQCSASAKAAELLEEKGFDVLDYEGGITDWAEADYPTEGEMHNEEFLNA